MEREAPGRLVERLIETEPKVEKYKYSRKDWAAFVDYSESKWDAVKRYWVNDGPKLVLITLFIILNVGLFVERFTYYYLRGGRKYYELFGHGVTIARASAQALKLDCSVILLMVCRNIISWLRGTWLNNIVPFDKNIVFHRYIGWTIVFWTVLHIGAHFFNWYTLWTTPVSTLNGVLGTHYTSNPSTYQVAFLTMAGATGHGIVLCMVLIYSAAVESIRRPFFEVFWYSHHLFILFYILLCVHGFFGLFGPPEFWMWFAGPALLYIIERTIRIIRGSQPVVLVRAIQHPSKVIELQLSKTKFHYKPGQYLFLNVPYFSEHEWHPFTISSAPQDESIVVHIRIVGDWTGMLYKELNPNGIPTGILCENIKFAKNGSPILRVDGPFGAASEDIFDFQFVVLIAAGIGVTPFASILKTITHAIEDGSGREESRMLPMRKVHFFWINRDAKAFEWFHDVLQHIESSPAARDILELNIYFTGNSAANTSQIKDMMQRDEENVPDVLTGLRSKTHYGRPRWDSIFDGLAHEYPGQTVGVFFCGPKILSKQLYKMCRRTTARDRNGTKFKYKKENF